jgi:hypothetical protein
MRFWHRTSVLFLAAAPGVAMAQSPQPRPAVNQGTAKKANELTLAGLRPGKDAASRLFRLYPSSKRAAIAKDGQISWEDPCRQERLTLDIDSGKNVQVIRVGRVEDPQMAHCDTTPVPSRWRTGLGLRILDQAQSVIQLYGEPDSRSPSTKDGQPLELWYYAFDWAGADVPQVMEVVCTKEKDGQAGRVVEITLAAPSL